MSETYIQLPGLVATKESRGGRSWVIIFVSFYHYMFLKEHFSGYTRFFQLMQVRAHITCDAGVHGFVYLIYENTGDTNGKMCWMKGIHLLPHAHTGALCQYRSPHIQYMHAYTIYAHAHKGGQSNLIPLLCVTQNCISSLLIS